MLIYKSVFINLINREKPKLNNSTAQVMGKTLNHVNRSLN